MARKARFNQVGVTVLLDQPTSPSAAIMREEEDFRYMQQCLADGLGRFGCELHSYSLLHNRMLLLMTPRIESGVANLMQSIGRKYSAYFSTQYTRRKSLWGTRYRCIPIEAESYMVDCMCFVETTQLSSLYGGANILRKWSSYDMHCPKSPDEGVSELEITPHPVFLELSHTRFAADATYQSKRQGFADSPEYRRILRALTEQVALGSPGYIRALEIVSGQRLTVGSPGRPKKPG